MCKMDGGLDAILYREILVGEMMWTAANYFSDHALIFQQDNDPKHTSKSVQEWLARHEVQTLEWPSNSPPDKSLQG